MKSAALLLAFVLLGTGCAGRDYHSINRRSWQFLKEGVRKSPAIRRQSLDSYKGVGTQNKANSSHSVKYFWDTFFGDEKENWRKMVEAIREEKKPAGARSRSVRFGFVDSGE